MCTVSIVPCGDGFRLACNRDERRNRPAATHPTTHRVGNRTAIFPVDPQGGGTWIGVNDCGLAATLLNRTPEGGRRRTVPARSRGLIIPSLLACASLVEALDMATAIDPSQYELFRLVLGQPMAAAILTSDGRTLALDTASVSEPIMWTSSSLGDGVVEGPRRALFESKVQRREPSAWLAAQMRFHAHQWRARPEVSVLMGRADARTVSRTFVRVTSSGMDLRYCQAA
jgi:Transport and Golgi organisation 2